MEKKTIGAFIAALRKASGMTQQELADKLTVSNKAVSRWERDECAPDISLIPAIAEIFDVTCDELLKGERIINSPTQPPKSEPKVEKQKKAIVNRALGNYKIMCCTSIAGALIGFILMLGISYGFDDPVIGFVLMLIFEIAALFVAIIGTVKIKEISGDSETLEVLDTSLIAKINKVLGNYSFASFFSALTAILMSIPLLVGDFPYYNVVISFGSYLRLVLPVVLLLILAFLYCKKPIIALITGVKTPRGNKKYKLWCDLFGIVPFVLLIIADVLKVVFGLNDVAILVFDIVDIALLVIALVAGILLIIKYKRYGVVAVLTVIRNWLMFIPTIIILMGMGMIHLQGGVSYLNISYYNIYDAAVATLVIFAVFGVIEKLLSKKFLNKEPDEVTCVAMEAAEKGKINQSSDNADVMTE